MRKERCACGGVIVADETDPPGVQQAVYGHVLSRRHQEWRARGGLDVEARPETVGEIVARMAATQQVVDIAPARFRYACRHDGPARAARQIDAA